MTKKLNEKQKAKLSKLKCLRQPISEEIELLESMNEEINHHLEELPKSMLISKSDEIISTLEEINGRSVLQNQFSENDRKLEFQYEMF